MFDLPDSKRVRREDLNSSAASTASEDEDATQAREALEAQIARSLGIDVSAPRPATAPKHTESKPAEPAATGGSDKEDEEMEEAFDFCLFGGSAAPTTTRIVLEKDEGPQGEGDIISTRPSSYYLAKPYSSEEQERFAHAAITAEQVFAIAEQRHWTDEMPWKVTHITVHTKGSSLLSTNEEGKAAEGEEEEKRRRPGKKRRLALKQKERKKKEKEEEKRKKKVEKEKSDVVKEEFLKEKKKRANRARKLKRREKAREERRARGEVVGDDEADGDGDSGSE